jgi:hypothetical protein
MEYGNPQVTIAPPTPATQEGTSAAHEVETGNAPQTPLVAAERITLRYEEVKNNKGEWKGIRLSANGRTIEFSGKGRKPSNEIQLIRLLISKFPNHKERSENKRIGLLVSEIFKEMWPEILHADRESVSESGVVKSKMQCLVAMGKKLRDKASTAGLPEDIFPKFSSATLRDPQYPYALTCRGVTGADHLQNRTHIRGFAQPLNENLSEKGKSKKHRF